MFFRRFSISVALCLVLAAAVPPSLASAVTMEEVYNYSISSGEVLGVSSYPPVTVTSPTNRSLKVTVTPLRFLNGKWDYQIEWTRTRDAVGSLYISLKSDRSQSVLSVDYAKKSDSATFSANPRTAYILEFDSQPLKQGMIMLRKTLVVRPEEAGYSSLYNADPSAGASTAGLLTVSTGAQSTKFDYLGERIGEGLQSSGALTCNKAAWGLDSVNMPDEALANAICRNTGKAIVLSLDYKESSTGFCIHHDWTGKYKFDCRVHKALLGGKDPQVLTGSVPTNATDSRLNYSAYNAQCFQAVNHAPGGYWGQCGAMDQSQPSAEWIINNVVPEGNWNAGASTAGLFSTSNEANSTKFNYLGERVGEGYFSSGSLICPQAARTDAAGGDRVLADAICRNTGKGIVLSINYKESSTGFCYHKDWTGKYKFDCRLMKALLGGKDPQVLSGEPPTNALDTRLNYGAYAAQCFQAVDHAPGGYWGQCGAMDQSQPSAEAILNTVVPEGNWNAGASTMGLLTISKEAQSTKFNYLGERVGEGLQSSGALTCDKAAWGLDSASFPDESLANAICRNTSKGIVLSLDYKESSTGFCIHHDWTGKYKFDCRVHKALLGGKDPQVLTGSVPTNATDTRLNYSAYNASCFQAVNHAPGGYWGQCGAADQSQPSADWILNNAYSPSRR